MIWKNILILKRLLTGKNYIEDEGLDPKVPFLHKGFIRKSFAQQGEDLVLDRVLYLAKIHDLKKGIYVDVGAYHPIMMSVTYKLYLRGWDGMAIDPSSVSEKKFKKYRSRDIFIRCVIGNQDNIDVSFFIKKTSVDGFSALNTKYPKKEEEFDHVLYKQRNLNAVLSEHDLQAITVLNLDIEGAEYETLVDFDFEKFNPKVIIIEIHGKDIIDCLNSKPAILLLEKGYSCVASTVITFFFIKTN
jgi:FkbM family methyltransferase